MNATTPSRLSAFPRSSSCVMALWQVAEKLSHMVRGMHMTYIIFNSSFNFQRFSCWWLHLHFSASSTAIPALQPIVHDLFVLRGSNKADAGKELDTQKEVVVSMLLRLVQYHQVCLQVDAETQHATSSDIQPTCFLPCSCFHVSAAGVGDVHSCTAAVSQREWRQVEEIIQTDCRRHTSHDCQAAGSKLFASLYVGLTLMVKANWFLQ